MSNEQIEMESLKVQIVSSDDFAENLLRWYDHAGRKDLPWQTDATPYRVWISEIMLQQTQVKTAIPYFERFMARFPDIGSLAAASADEVLALWSGLGYYARARNLHRGAVIIRDRHRGRFPEKLEAVKELPGIGRSTAGAILALSKGERHPILDGNVKRVLSRYHAVKGKLGTSGLEKKLWQLSEGHTPHKRVREYTQAIMDLGATVCTRTSPQCGNCPVGETCMAFSKGEAHLYPESKRRKPLPTRETCMLLIRDTEGRTLLERRAAAGLWGGLWSLPECGNKKDAVRWCLDALGLEPGKINPLPSFRHTFTHFHLRIHPLRVEVGPHSGDSRLKADMAWHTLSGALTLGLPAPVRSILEGR